MEREEKYNVVKENLQRYEAHDIDDADIIISSYGITSRVVETAVKSLREEGIKVGVIRPITLWPFPEKILKRLNRKRFCPLK